MVELGLEPKCLYGQSTYSFLYIMLVLYCIEKIGHEILLGDCLNTHHAMYQSSHIYGHRDIHTYFPMA